MQFQWRKEWMIPSGVGIVSFTLGALAGYLYSQHKGTGEIVKVVTGFKDDLSAEGMERAERQQELLREFGRDFEETVLVAKGVVHELRNEGQTLNEHHAAQMHAANDEEAKHEMRMEIEKERIAETMERVGQQQFSVFLGDDNEWDYDVEVPLRTPDKPYIIHREEYYANEESNSQSSLTYYAGDDVLCDEQDVPVYDYRKIVGKLEFGKGSEDISVVYVRNEKLQAEWEILLDHGYFTAEVLGEEIEHSYERRDLKHGVHKFRDD